MKDVLIPNLTPLLKRSLPFFETARDVLSCLGVSSNKYESGCIDGGIVGYEDDYEKALFNNAYNLLEASKSTQNIICIDDTSFANLTRAQQKLQTDAKLQKLTQTLDVENVASLEHICQTLSSFSYENKITRKLTDFSAALYVGDLFCDTNANMIQQSTQNVAKKINLRLVNNKKRFETNPARFLRFDIPFALHLASKILLDAQDSGADMLILSDSSVYVCFNEFHKEIEKVAGREIEIPLVNLSTLLLMSFGKNDMKNLGLHNNKRQPSFIS